MFISYNRVVIEVEGREKYVNHFSIKVADQLDLQNFVPSIQYEKSMVRYLRNNNKSNRFLGKKVAFSNFLLFFAGKVPIETSFYKVLLDRYEFTRGI